MSYIMNNPKLSLNKFGEYFTASASRKETIIRDAKYGKESERGARYVKARKAIKQYFLSEFNKTVINDAITDLKSKVPKTDWQKSDIESSLSALKIVLETDFSRFANFKISVYRQPFKTIEIEGVEININPDLLLRINSNKDTIHIGALKIHISKNNLLKEEASKNISTLLHQFLIANVLKDNEVVKPNMSFSYDVFSSNIGTAPSSIAKRWKNIEATCRSIKLYWDSI